MRQVFGRFEETAQCLLGVSHQTKAGINIQRSYASDTPTAGKGQVNRHSPILACVGLNQ